MSEKDLFFLRPFSWLRQIKERELKGYGGSAEGLVNVQTGELRQEIRDQIREQVVKVGGGVGPG